MGSIDLSALLKDSGRVFKDNGRRFFSIIHDPVAFIRSLDHSSGEELLSASLFAALVSLLNLAINLPLLRVLRIETENASFVLADTILTFAFWFVFGTVFHLAAKLMRGNASYTSTLTAYLYLRAFTPLIVLLGIPYEARVRPIIIGSPEPFGLEVFRIYFELAQSSPSAFVTLLLVSVITVYYLICLYRVLRAVHGVGRGRGLALLLVGFNLQGFVEVVVMVPVMQLLWKAFQVPAA
jgi:hypothetical protein